MAIRWTKDHAAVMVTTAYLSWFVVIAFLPRWYAPAQDIVYGNKGVYLLVWELYAVPLFITLYLVLARNLPERKGARAG